MRFLFSFSGGSGHFLPTLPIARALTARGHELAYACQEAMVETVEAAGFEVFASGGRTLLDPTLRRPLAPLDPAAEERAIRNWFAGRTARERAGRLLEVIDGWRPNVVVRDEMDFGAVVAAEATGRPHAAVIVIAAGGFVGPRVVAEPLSQLRVEHGLAPDPELDMLHRYLTLVPVPPSFRDPHDPLPATAHHFRPAVLDDGNGGPDVGPSPGPGTDGRPTVYFTLGTIFHQESGDLFSRVLNGLAELPVDVVVTVGREIDPAELGDQPFNADRCLELGVAQVLDAPSSTPPQIGGAVAEVLADGSYRDAASRLRDEIRDLPGAAHAAQLLERPVPDHRPLLTPPVLRRHPDPRAFQPWR